MRLFYSPPSPFVRKVAVLLHELDKTDAVTFEQITTTPMATDEGLKAANPLGRIPALERPDGVTLYDSRVIMAYLDDLFDSGLYPTGSARWEALTLEATADGIIDSAVSMFYEKRFRSEEKQSSEWIEAQWAKISRALTALNARWMSHLSGPLNMAQISVACALSYLDFRHDDRNWRNGNDALAQWHAKFSERPSMIATRPDS